MQSHHRSQTAPRIRAPVGRHGPASLIGESAIRLVTALLLLCSLERWGYLDALISTLTVPCPLIVAGRIDARRPLSLRCPPPGSAEKSPGAPTRRDALQRAPNLSFHQGVINHSFIFYTFRGARHVFRARLPGRLFLCQAPTILAIDATRSRQFPLLVRACATRVGVALRKSAGQSKPSGNMAAAIRLCGK